MRTLLRACSFVVIVCRIRIASRNVLSVASRAATAATTAALGAPPRQAKAQLLQHFLPPSVIDKLANGAALPFTANAPRATFLFADIVGALAPLLP